VAVALLGPRRHPGQRGCWLLEARNLYLLVSRRTAPRLVSVGHSFPGRASPFVSRFRILHEFHATGGDVRRVCDLFGLTVEGATRYLKTLEHPT